MASNMQVVMRDLRGEFIRNNKNSMTGHKSYTIYSYSETREWVSMLTDGYKLHLINNIYITRHLHFYCCGFKLKISEFNK